MWDRISNSESGLVSWPALVGILLALVCFIVSVGLAHADPADKIGLRPGESVNAYPSVERDEVAR